MFISPNQPRAYRNWAHCCIAIRHLSGILEKYSRRTFTTVAKLNMIKTEGRTAYEEHCRMRSGVITRKLARYARLRDAIAAEFDAPEKHLLPVCGILDMVGNVIEITPRHSREKVYKSLLECSPDGTSIDREFDAYRLLEAGYGK